MRNKLVMVFIDGVGLGQDSKENPLQDLFSDTAGRRILVKGESVKDFGNGILLPVDPCMGVPGLPQSATGQTSIFTGVNAAEILGYHLTAFPDKKLVEFIKARGLMRKLSEMGVSVTSANLYTKEFFQKKDAYDHNMLPVSTLVIKGGGAGMRFIEDYYRGGAVFADITNRLLIQRDQGYSIDLITPEQAAENLLRISRKTDFVFFEYFLTDHYGHRMKYKKLSECAENLNRFMKYSVDNADRNTHFLIVSDHGNAEDISTSAHTMNPVPMLVFSNKESVKEHFSSGVKYLYDIYSKVIDMFNPDTFSKYRASGNMGE